MLTQEKQKEKDVKELIKEKERDRNKRELKEIKEKRDKWINVDDIFRQTSRINMHINAKLDEISYWKALASKAEIVFSAVKTTGGPGKNRSRIEDCVCKIAEIEESLQEEMTELIGLKEKAMRIIERIDVPEYRSLLIHRYVCGKKWEDVADSMGYSYVHTVNRLHPKALKRLSELAAEN